MGVAIGATSRRAAPHLAHKLGATRTNTVGLTVAAVGFVVLATLDATSSYWHVFVGLIILGAGMGIATTPATSAIVVSLPDSKQGVASAVNDAAREVGGAVGIAVLGSVLSSGYRGDVERHTEGLPPDAAERASDSLAFVVHGADRLGPAGEQLLGVARESFVNGMQTAMWVGASVMALGALAVQLLHRGERRNVDTS